MSASPTYVLFCDGTVPGPDQLRPCRSFFVLPADPARRVGEVREQAAGLGWTYGTKPQTGRPTTSDYCPTCSGVVGVRWKWTTEENGGRP